MHRTTEISTTSWTSYNFARSRHEIKPAILQLAKLSIDPKFVELTADVLEIFLLNIVGGGSLKKCVINLVFHSFLLDFSMRMKICDLYRGAFFVRCNRFGFRFGDHIIPTASQAKLRQHREPSCRVPSSGSSTSGLHRSSIIQQQHFTSIPYARTHHSYGGNNASVAALNEQHQGTTTAKGQDTALLIRSTCPSSTKMAIVIIIIIGSSIINIIIIYNRVIDIYPRSFFYASISQQHQQQDQQQEH